MKYFTPELLARYGSYDEKVADAAHYDWEQLHAAYLRELDSIREKLPKKLQSLLKNFYLHDAKVAGAFSNKKCFLIVLQLDAQPERVVVVRYELAGKPRILRHRRASEDEPPLEWLYDEIHQQKGRPSPVFTHAILFTGGWELQLPFRGLDWDTYRKVMSPKDLIARSEVTGTARKRSRKLSTSAGPFM
jgi:hypothetical protein